MELWGSMAGVYHTRAQAVIPNAQSPETIYCHVSYLLLYAVCIELCAPPPPSPKNTSMSMHWFSTLGMISGRDVSEGGNGNGKGKRAHCTKRPPRPRVWPTRPENRRPQTPRRSRLSSALTRSRDRQSAAGQRWPWFLCSTRERLVIHGASPGPKFPAARSLLLLLLPSTARATSEPSDFACATIDECGRRWGVYTCAPRGLVEMCDTPAAAVPEITSRGLCRRRCHFNHRCGAFAWSATDGVCIQCSWGIGHNEQRHRVSIELDAGLPAPNGVKQLLYGVHYGTLDSMVIQSHFSGAQVRADYLTKKYISAAPVEFKGKAPLNPPPETAHTPDAFLHFIPP